MTPDKVDTAKNIVDVGAGVLGMGVIIGWVHISVGIVTATYTLVRLWGWFENRRRVKAEDARLTKEKAFYIDALCKWYGQPATNFDFLPVEELRKQYDQIRNKIGGDY